MRAIVQDQYGPDPEQVLRPAVVDPPVAADGEVLVRVHASSVDRGTWHVMAGVPYPIRLAGFGLRRPSFANPGLNLAGVVVRGAEGFKAGDEVFGSGRSTFAEVAVAPVAKLAHKPSSVSWAQAAAVPVSGVTALQAVRDKGRVGPGNSVLVLGAAGGVGSFAVQIAVALGGTVTGVCSGAKASAVRDLGVTQVIDYTREPLDGTWDVVIDTGGRRPLSELRRVLAPRGRLVIVGGEKGGRWLDGLDRQLRAHVLSLFVKQSLGTFVASENAADLRELASLLESGAVVSLVDRSFALEETAAAVRWLLDGNAAGKVVVSVTDESQPLVRSTGDKQRTETP